MLIDEKVLGKEHPYTATSYENLGDIYKNIGEYSKAMEYYKKTLLIREKSLGKDHLYTAESYDDLAVLYKNMGEYPKALEYAQKALDIRKKVLKEEHADIAESYNTLAMLYKKLGKYPKALEYAQKTMLIDEKVLGKEHLYTATSYSSLGDIYSNMGEYPKALKYYLEALSIQEKIVGEEHAYVAESNDDLGRLYKKIGNYSKSLEYYKKSLTIRKKVLGEEHADTAESYNSLAMLYKKLGKYAKALEYAQKTMLIDKKVLGKEHPYTAKSYENLGDIYNSLAEYPKALRYYLKGLLIRKKVLGDHHIDTAESYYSLGVFYKKMKKYSKSLSYHQKALTIRTMVLGNDHADIAESYHSMGALYQVMDNYPQAYHYAKLSFDIFLKNRDKVFSILNCNQKRKYLKAKSNSVILLLDTSSKYLLQVKIEGKTTLLQQLLQSGTNDWIKYKGSIFDSENAIVMLYTNTKDSEVKTKIDDLISAKRYLAKLYQSLPKPKERDAWQKSIKTSERKIAQLTNEISAKATSFKEQQGLMSINYTDISSQLKEKELYIDYAKVGNHYYLFSLDSKENITFNQINSNNTKRINTLVEIFRESINTIINNHNITDEKLKNLTQGSKEKLSKLYELIIQKPLKNTLKDKTTLIISPDGALRLLPFEALYDKEHNKYFIEEKEIRYIPSGKELVRLYRYSKDKLAKSTSVIFANPNFNTKIASLSKEEIAITPNTNRSGIIKSLFMMRFAPLPGTEAEAKAIKATLKKDTVSEYQTDNATESTLMRIKEPKILHIATHGFFINDNTIPNPMLKSGIALAGANDSAIKGKSDGIVTALKLSGLDLKGTDLVVLSACETGVVDINSTDSVSGLSKAFIQAGAKDIVMSLWPVDDQATKELMTSFYQEMRHTKNYTKALKAAKMKMIKDGKHPFYWAAFVVSGL